MSEEPWDDNVEAPTDDVQIRKIFLDTTVLYTHPEILSRAPEGIELTITSPVLAELVGGAGRFGPARLALDIVRTALGAGVLHQEEMQTTERVPLRGLSPVDMALLRMVYNQRDAGAALATNDQALFNAARGLGTPAFTAEGLLAWLAARPATDVPELHFPVRVFQVAVVGAGLLLATVALGGGFAIAKYGPGLAANILQSLGWVSFVMALPIGMALFALRERERVIYGFGEVAFGMASVTLGVTRLRTESIASLEGLMAIAAGLYVIVRGLDNLEKAKTSSLSLLFRFLVGSIRWAATA